MKTMKQLTVSRIHLTLLISLGVFSAVLLVIGYRFAVEEHSTMQRRFYLLFRENLTSLREEVAKWQIHIEEEVSALTRELALEKRTTASITSSSRRFVRIIELPAFKTAETNAPQSSLTIRWVDRAYSLDEPPSIRTNYLGRDFLFTLNSDEILEQLIDVINHTPHSANLPLQVTLTDSTNRELASWGTTHVGESVLVTSVNLPQPFHALRLMGIVSKGSWNQSLYGRALLTFVPSMLLSILLLLALAFILLQYHHQREEDAKNRLQLVNSVSHEFKTPLTNIRLYAELLERRIDTDDTHAHQYLETILRESGRLSRIITSVMSFGKLTHGSLSITPTCSGDPLLTLQTIIESFRELLRADSITIKLNLGCGQQANFDQDAFHQIAGNLITNVQRHAASGKYLSVRAKQLGDTVFVRFTDRGPGISATLLPRLFEPFATGGRKGGTGLGLNISRELANLHGGSLRNLSSSSGAVFLLRLRVESITSKVSHRVEEPNAGLSM